MPLANVLVDVHEKFEQKRRRILDYKKSMDYSTSKLENWDYLLQGSFDLKNGLFCSSGPKKSTANILTTLTKKFLKKDVGFWIIKKDRGL